MNENNVLPMDKSFHDWFRFVLAYPPHLVRGYLEKFDVKAGMTVLDPFAGTGTTLVECKKNEIESVGLEANSLTAFAGSVKLSWDVSAADLRNHAEQIAESTQRSLNNMMALIFLPSEKEDLLIKGSISPLPLHKVLVLLKEIDTCNSNPFQAYEHLAVAKILNESVSNIKFAPEPTVRKQKEDADVIGHWLTAMLQFANDIEQSVDSIGRQTNGTVHFTDARQPMAVLEPASIDAVITSPPYPTEKDYTRVTRLESVILSHILDKKQLRALKEGLLRSNTRNIYKGDTDSEWIKDHLEVQLLAKSIEDKRIELGKTSGFERCYHKVVTNYFGGMARHLCELRPALKPGAMLAYVVGDQASFFQTHIHTGQILGSIAHSLGYQVEGLDLFRTRRATATGVDLREEVLLLKWCGTPF